jgi:hypothetical protein
MSLPKHLEEAADRLKDASYRVEEARAKALTLESLRDWLAALTDYTVALRAIHDFNNESIHEKLHEIAWRFGVKDKL